MVKSLKAWFKGLFAPRAQAQGLYNEPTAAQVERLIAAAKGEEYRPPERAPLYSKPTYSQFERLIAAVAASSSSGSAEVARLDGAKRDKDDLSTYAYPATPGYWTSGEDRFYPVDGSFPTSKGIYTWACGDNRIQYNPTNGNIYRAFWPTTTVTTPLTDLDPRKPSADLGTWQIGNDGRTFSYTAAVAGGSLEKDGDSIARKSYVDASVAGTVDGAGYDAKYGNEQKPTILLKHGNRVVATVDATDFVVDGMVDDVYIGTATSGPEGTQDEDESGKLVIKFNTDAGAKVIRIPLAKIFNLDNYPTRQEVNGALAGKLDSTSAAPEFSEDSSVQYAVGSHVTYNGKLYRCTTATTGGTWTGSANWTAEPMTDTLRYDCITITTGQLQDHAAQKVRLNAATTTLTLPALTDLTGKVSDFGIDVVNGYAPEVGGTPAPAAASFQLDGMLGTDYNLIVPDGETWSEMTELAPNEMAVYYFTLSAFWINDKPTWEVMKKVVTLVPVPSAP